MMMHLKTLLATPSRKGLVIFLVVLTGWMTYVNFWFQGGNRGPFESSFLGAMGFSLLWSVIFVAVWTAGDVQKGIGGQFLLNSSDRLAFVIKRFLSVTAFAVVMGIFAFLMASAFAENFSFLQFKYFAGGVATVLIYSLLAMFFSFMFRSSWMGWISTMFVMFGMESLTAKYINERLATFISPEHYLVPLQEGTFSLTSVVGCVVIAALTFLGRWLIFRKMWV